MKFKFVGSGAGIPGLPHTVSQEEIDQMSGLERAVFDSALKSKLYEEVAEDAQTDPGDPPRKAKPKKLAAADEGA